MLVRHSRGITLLRGTTAGDLQRLLDLADGTRTAEEIVEVVTEGEMPIRAYLLTHPGAELTAADVETIRAWAGPAEPSEN